jgi:hypothetical protein
VGPHAGDRGERIGEERADGGGGLAAWRDGRGGLGGVGLEPGQPRPCPCAALRVVPCLDAECPAGPARVRRPHHDLVVPCLDAAGGRRRSPGWANSGQQATARRRKTAAVGGSHTVSGMRACEQPERQQAHERTRSRPIRATLYAT